MPADTSRTTKDAERGIRGVDIHYKQTVRGDFDKKSMVGKIAKTALAATPIGLTSKAGTLGVNYVTRKARRFRKQSNTERSVKGTLHSEDIKKLEGPSFWLIVMFAVTKDLLDVVFTITFFFAFLSAIFGVIINLTILFYLIFNDVSFTTRKVVPFVASTIIEFLPIISALLPMTTINILLIQKFENNDRLRSSKKKEMNKKGALINKLRLIAQ